jgi:hypothetical protein
MARTFPFVLSEVEARATTTIARNTPFDIARDARGARR